MKLRNHLDNQRAKSLMVLRTLQEALLTAIVIAEVTDQK